MSSALNRKPGLTRQARTKRTSATVPVSNRLDYIRLTGFVAEVRVAVVGIIACRGGGVGHEHAADIVHVAVVGRKVDQLVRVVEIARAGCCCCVVGVVDDGKSKLVVVVAVGIVEILCKNKRTTFKTARLARSLQISNPPGFGASYRTRLRTPGPAVLARIGRLLALLLLLLLLLRELKRSLNCCKPVKLL